MVCEAFTSGSVLSNAEEIYGAKGAVSLIYLIRERLAESIFLFFVLFSLISFLSAVIWFKVDLRVVLKLFCVVPSRFILN